MVEGAFPRRWLQHVQALFELQEIACPAGSCRGVCFARWIFLDRCHLYRRSRETHVDGAAPSQLGLRVAVCARWMVVRAEPAGMGRVLPKRVETGIRAVWECPNASRSSNSIPIPGYPMNSDHACLVRG